MRNRKRSRSASRSSGAPLPHDGDGTPQLRERSLAVTQGFNEQFQETAQTQKAYSIPDAELREATRQGVIDMLVPLYTRFLDLYANVQFSKNPGKYILYRAEELPELLRHLFDTSS